MQKLVRPPEPEWFKKLATKSWWKNSKSLNLVKEELAKMSRHHCFYCDELLYVDADLDEFIPKTINLEIAFEWINLYLCCRTCNHTKGAKYDERLLRPDASDYSFDRYFEIDFKTGNLIPNSNASIEDQERAEITIISFGFNRSIKVQSRLYALKDIQQQIQSLGHFTKATIDLPYRFFIEKGISNLLTKTFNPIKINKIQIKNVRCFDDVIVEFNTNRNLIVGTNSRGKSTILQLIAIGLLKIEYVPFTSSWYEVVRKNNSVGFFELEITFQNEIIILKYEVDVEDKIKLISDKMEYEKVKEVLVLGYGSNRFIKYQEEKPNNVKIQPVATLFGENDYLKHIRKLNTFLQINIHFETLKELINEIFAKSDPSNQIQLQRYDESPKQDRPITFYFLTPSNPSLLIPLEALSDGFKATFVWLFDMVIRIIENLGNINNRHLINGIILIDEIDLHIHPRWQRTILPTLCDYFPNIQFIVTTHSDLVAQSIEPKYIKKLVLDEKKSIVNVEKVKYGKGSSSNFIYKDVFDIEETFDIETESELKQFMDLRTKVLKSELSVNANEVKYLVKKITSKSKQLEQLISQELNQIQRLKGEVFTL